MTEPTLQAFVSWLLSKATDFAVKLLAAAVVLTVGRLLVRGILKRIKRSKLAKRTDETVLQVLTNFISAGLYLLLAVSVIGILGVPMASVVAIVASAGVAIGLALQGALSNLAGGIMIMLLRPFHLGSFVEIADNIGTVKDVGIFYTVLTTTDNKVVTIPNGTVMGSEIINYSANETRRVELVFGVAYSTDAERVKSILLEEAYKHEKTLKNPEPFARLSDQGESSLKFTLRVWAKNEDFWTVKLDLLEAIHKRFEKESIKIPFNQLEVHVAKQ